MTWHYQATHYVVDGHDVYEVREVHDDPRCWTKDAIAPYGSTREELIECLENMLADVKKWPVLEVEA